MAAPQWKPPEWTMYLVPLIFPAGIAVAFVLGRALPRLSEGTLAFVATAGPLLVISLLAIATRRRGRRRAGLVPESSGFSAQVDLLASKLRERAAEIEDARRFGKEVGDASELASFAEEVKRIARQMDQRAVGGTLTADAFAAGAMERARQKEWIERAALLRETAQELAAYAQDVRARGGIYKAKAGETLGCGLVLLALGGAGAWMIVAVPSAFGWGVTLVALAAVLAAALASAQREAA